MDNLPAHLEPIYTAFMRLTDDEIEDMIYDRAKALPDFIRPELDLPF